jgi:hypothetical protein
MLAVAPPANWNVPTLPIIGNAVAEYNRINEIKDIDKLLAWSKGDIMDNAIQAILAGQQAKGSRRGLNTINKALAAWQAGNTWLARDLMRGSDADPVAWGPDVDGPRLTLVRILDEMAANTIRKN